MKLLVLVIPCFYWISLCQCYYDDDCPLGYSYQQCDADKKGYSYYDCYGEDDIRKSSGSGWRCIKNYVCECQLATMDEDPSQSCKCVNPTKPAPFPAVGVIRWSGTYDFDYEPTVNLKGVVYKDMSGNYLMSKININGDRELEILIRNGDGSKFDKYTYKDAEKRLCKKEEVTGEKYLHSIWEMKDDFVLTDEQESKGKKVTRTWNRNIGVDWVESAIMTVEYNKEENVAIPVKFYSNDYDIKGVPDIYTRINYKYESLGKAETGFNIEDYCTNQGEIW